ncbi:peptidyl-dipeptidase dcp [Salmonella enterica subsp. enterica]|nr:peptidyl-dipeptidase dcp [Salmonella enterica subsp. enterica serovar Chittagong]EBY5131000.1 peptidyl-dipeptidase dcp [Salmonella enterica subsp. enterica serovar Brazzaville]ECE6339893.1 peptidyl-dipeptidase dcp [Salmonella enterica subsp. enterica]ECG1258822.1 peptidyl-dipeptidase dcp [Salmonella enterica subsp. enterica]ECI2730391.1 peptidyl-dipeptidase dcp [Salmonella enterica subsp. enterica]
MELRCLNIKKAGIRIFLLIFLWCLDYQRFITASLLTFLKIYFLLYGGFM